MTRFFTLSPAQVHVRRFWPADELPNMVGSRYVAVAQPRGDVVAALGRLVARHDALRSRIVVLGSTVLQAVDEVVPDAVRCRQLTDGEPVDVAALRRSAVASRLDPADGAARFLVLAHGDRACGVLVVVHHLFADRFGLLALQDDLAALLAGVPVAELPRCAQPSAFASAAHATAIAANNEFWQRQLRPAARSCTVAVGRRRPQEQRAHIRLRVPARLGEQMTATASRLRTGPAVLWSAALSLLVRAWTGASRQVFEATLTNRRSPADFRAVAEIDQVVYLPVDLTDAHTASEIVRTLRRAYLLAYDRSDYRSDMVTGWLARAENFLGAAFRPTFGVNYLAPPLPGPAGPGAPPPGAPPPGAPPPDATEVVSVELHEDRYDPRRHASDLSAVVKDTGAGTEVLLQVIEPLWRARAPHAIAADLLTVVRQLVDPSPAGAADVAPLPGVRALHTGHRSAAGVDPRAVADMITTHPAVRRARVTTQRADTLLVHAEVEVDRPVPLRELIAHARGRQPWFLGAVVPDRWSVLDARG